MADYHVPKSTKIDGGIKGWLAIFTIGALLTPLRMLWDVASSLSGYKEIWKLGYQPIVVIEVLGNLVFFVGSIYGIRLLLTLRRSAKKFYLLFLAGNFLFLFLDNIVSRYMLDDLVSKNMITPAVSLDIQNSLVPDLERGFLVAIIWIPYLLKSKRVKATFRHPLPPEVVAE